MATTTAAIRKLLSREGGEEAVALLTIDHPDLDAPMRLCRNSVGDDIVSNGDTYTAAPFDIQWVQDNDEAPKVQVSIVNVDRAAWQGLETITEPATCDLAIIYPSDPDELIMPLTGMELRNARGDAIFVQAELSHFSWAAEPFPSLRVTPQFFPGLFS